MKWHMEEGVCGHRCSGLDAFQLAGGGCVPHFGKLGETIGCDDENDNLLVYCPFCGTKLAETYP